jgi:hypothetical protein
MGVFATLANVGWGQMIPASAGMSEQTATRRNLYAWSPGRNLENVQCAGSFDSEGSGLEVA